VVDAHLCLQGTFTALGFTGVPVEQSLKVCAKICAEFESCAWGFGQLSRVLWPEREGTVGSCAPALLEMAVCPSASVGHQENACLTSRPVSLLYSRNHSPWSTPAAQSRGKSTCAAHYCYPVPRGEHEVCLPPSC